MQPYTKETTSWWSCWNWTQWQNIYLMAQLYLFWPKHLNHSVKPLLWRYLTRRVVSNFLFLSCRPSSILFRSILNSTFWEYSSGVSHGAFLIKDEYKNYQVHLVWQPLMNFPKLFSTAERGSNFQCSYKYRMLLLTWKQVMRCQHHNPSYLLHKLADYL